MDNLTTLNLNSTSLSESQYYHLKDALPRLQHCDITYTDAWSAQQTSLYLWRHCYVINALFYRVNVVVSALRRIQCNVAHVPSSMMTKKVGLHSNRAATIVTKQCLWTFSFFTNFLFFCNFFFVSILLLIHCGESPIFTRIDPSQLGCR